ncbi:glutamine synthetase [Sinomicrobium oceani]|uniref:Glutamine synthetase n=1 Tax=Sinomicrobium oceani TaxID=1150368 RepID=A0A1K1NEU4_9FLAO|nr:glutamine synthetase family protein [Sinomicrobium oceani]SFW33836.1 glutamine synthetase [Sinomicrobium oceani]
MNKQELITRLKESKHTKVKVAITDIDGVLRGKFMHRDKFISALENGFGFCSVVFGWDVNDGAYDNTGAVGWHMGYGDFDARIDPDTERTVPWEGNIPLFLADFDLDGPGRALCPRSLLRKITAEAEGLGYKPMYSQEFEWFNYRETTDALHEKDFKHPQAMMPGMFGYSVLKMSENSSFFHDLFDLLESFGVPLEGLHTETGPGVTEAAILYGDIVESADRATLFKAATKEIACRHGIIASFMAKQSRQLPGCSGHIHQSLWDADKKKNLFFEASDPANMSDLMKSFLAGQLHCLPEILPLFAPTINSYKRLVEGAWAPTTVTWGEDNRTVALRTLTASEKSARIEHRVVGSDVNPYLAMAGCLASGLYGIKKGLKLEIPATTGNGYEDKKHGVLPANLYEATQRMKNSALAREMFGTDFIAHFTGTREWEWRQFSAEVTDWETKRYFEII